MKVLLGIVGLTAGIVTSAGLVALLNAVGLIPRMAGRTKTATHLMLYESVIALGCTAGNLVYLFASPGKGGTILLIPFGICAGIFVGGLVMALTETASVIPIFERRIHLREGLPVLIVAFALGKLAGSLLYFARIME